jgi:hypothetical protein
MKCSGLERQRLHFRDLDLRDGLLDGLSYRAYRE